MYAPSHGRWTSATLALALALLVAGSARAQESRLGTIDFPNSGAPSAQGPFVRGVLLLHSFEFEDAATAFQAAQKADPTFALAYWGEAMTYNHPLWRQQDGDAARTALARYAPTPEARAERAPTERERGYLEAVDLLYGAGGQGGTGPPLHGGDEAAVRGGTPETSRPGRSTRSRSSAPATASATSRPTCARPPSPRRSSTPIRATRAPRTTSSTPTTIRCTPRSAWPPPARTRTSRRARPTPST